MNNLPEIKDIDAGLLTGLVRQALGSPTAEISHWEHILVSYINTRTSNLGLHRFKGTRDRGEARPWSIMLKAVHAPVNETNPTDWSYHRREILAYQDGLLANLPGGLAAPRCFGVTEYADGVCWLWLEDLLDSASPPWSLAEYSLTARHLGRFNGAYAAGQPLPALPWLSHDWLRGWLNFYKLDCQAILELIPDDQFWEHPLLKSSFSRRVTDDILRLWASYDSSLLATLDHLPQIFCHMDAYRPNLFIRRDSQGSSQTVAIDWVFAGISGIGEEIANLLAASLIWFEYDAAQAGNLDEAIFDGYLNGLREAGWQGDAHLVRLGYTSASALRWGLVGLWWMRSLSDADKQVNLEKHWGRPMPELVSQWAQTTYHVLGLAQEASQLPTRTLLDAHPKLPAPVRAATAGRASLLLILYLRGCDWDALGNSDEINITKAATKGYNKSMNAEQAYLLIVEDDPDILKLLNTTLTFKGYRVVTARNGREGLDVILGERPAIVIADIMMPKLDGFGLVHRIRINPETRDIPVVFITATYVAPEDREFALNIGATRFIQKPVDLDKFLATVAELLQQGMPVRIEPLKELDFYAEYRKRLEVKLDEKNRQIARDEELLGTLSAEEGAFMRSSLRHAISEREELKLLLEQIYEQIQKHDKPE